MKPLPSGRHLGNRRASYNPHRLFLAKYIDRSRFRAGVPAPQTVPLDMSVSPILQANPWIMTGIFANGPDDQAPASIASTGIGDCFFVAAARRAAVSAASVNKLLWTSYADMLKAVLQGYASTGFDINNPSATDQGTDPTQGFAYLSSTGLLLSDGTYDKQGVQLGVNPQDFEEVVIAFELSAGNITIGVNFPSAWDSSSIWTETTSSIEGGHEIPLFSDLNVTPKGMKLNSWGEVIVITPAGLAQQCIQCTAIIAPDSFGPGGTNVSGFDTEQLQADLKAQGAS